MLRNGLCTKVGPVGWACSEPSSESVPAWRKGFACSSRIPRGNQRPHIALAAAAIHGRSETGRRRTFWQSISIIRSTSAASSTWTRQQQLRADQRSLRFDNYSGKTVIAITGNYYAAYSARKINPGQRARSTFLNVVMPILKAAVPRFQNNQHVQGYAVEISHHIMGKVMGVSMERPENLMVFLPRNAPQAARFQG